MKKENNIVIMFVGMIVVIGVLALVLFFDKVNSKEKINVYLFWGNGCPHCEHAKDFFNNQNTEYSKYYNLVEYEVWFNDNNKKLMNSVAEKLNTQANGVPFIVIGNEYFSGYSSSINEDINKTIISMYESSEYVDIVEGLSK